VSEPIQRLSKLIQNRISSKKNKPNVSQNLEKQQIEIRISEGEEDLHVPSQQQNKPEIERRRRE
jgi:hypothetical protein